MSEFKIKNTLLSKKEQSLPDKEKQKLIEIRIKDEELRIKNDMEAEDRKNRAEEREYRKRKYTEDEEIKLASKIYKESSINWIIENIDLSVFKYNADLHEICLNLCNYK
jgi:hypothetical protein